MRDFLAYLQAALVGRYRVERELGRGGMATVYLARDLKHDRPVAIKLLRHELVAALGPERFLREIQVTANLQHPHILPLLDSGSLEDTAGRSRPYYVMPYVQGESLRDLLRRERQLPIDQAVRIACDVAAALDYAHERGVVHRDIKPENILLSGEQAVVADFGLARALFAAGDERLTETGLALGTPHYMSPEQASGDPAMDSRADVYALGCVLYEMLAGEPPYTGPTAQAIMAKRMIEPVPGIRVVRETVPRELEGAITRALAKTPADRFSTAAEFADALSGVTSAPPATRRVGISRYWRKVALLIAALAVGAAALRLWTRRPVISPSASLMAVLPLAPSGPDSALSRLGRDLVFTLSAELDGLGPIRVVDAHTVLAQARPGVLSTPAEGAVLARSFGAGSIVHGSLVREGPTVRLNFVLLSTDSAAAPLARVSVSSPPDSIAALTDSAVHVLLRQIWTRGSAPTPSLEAALKTRSVPALRAFLEGERQIVAGLWDNAAASYRHAREADPAFWLAHAREQFALSWTLRKPADSLVETLHRHRFELPEPERLTTEGIVLWSQDSIALALGRTRQLTERHPSSWFGWLIHADQLLHNGPLLGHSRDEARAGFQRALELNPNLIPVHEHLMLLALQDRDTAAAARGLRELTRLNAGPRLTADGYGNRMLQFRFLYSIERGDSALVRVLADSIAQDHEPAAVEDGSFYDAYRYGLLADQIQVSEQIVRTTTSPARQAVHRRMLALSWAQRGAWDSALVAMDRLVASEIDSAAAIRSYGLAVIGFWLGALDWREAGARRQAAVRSAEANAADRAELAWLDGLAAAGRRDRRALVQTRAALRKIGDPSVEALDRSLGAFDAALTGATESAGKTIADLEWQEAALSAPRFIHHPYTIVVHRLAAARWLAPSGGADQAFQLLTLVDGPFLLHPSTPYTLMMTGLVDLERGRIEEQRGRAGSARHYYREFLRRYDQPVSAHRRLVEEAETAITRLGGRED